MNITYLVVAHKLPDQLKRMISRLEAPWAQFFIHIDPKSKEKEDLTGVKSEVSPIFYIPSQTIRWAHVSQVEVTLSLLRAAMNAETKSDFFVLLSGQDYPIKPLSAIQSFFEDHAGMSFMEYFPLPSDIWKDGGLNRLEHYHFYLGNTFYSYPFNPSGGRKQQILNKLMRLFFSRKRPLPKEMRFYGGANWVTLSRQAVEDIFGYLEKNPDYQKLFKYSRSADEIFFQTILQALEKPLPIKNQLIHYCDWSLPEGPWPAIITKEYLGRLKVSPMLFARKFDVDVDREVLDQIDDQLLK